MTLLRQFDDLIYITDKYEVFPIKPRTKTHLNPEYLASLLDLDANPVACHLRSMHAIFPFPLPQSRSEEPPHTTMVYEIIKNLSYPVTSDRCREIAL